MLNNKQKTVSQVYSVILSSCQKEHRVYGFFSRTVKIPVKLSATSAQRSFQEAEKVNQQAQPACLAI